MTNRIETSKDTEPKDIKLNDVESRKDLESNNDTSKVSLLYGEGHFLVEVLIIVKNIVLYSVLLVDLAENVYCAIYFSRTSFSAYAIFGIFLTIDVIKTLVAMFDDIYPCTLVVYLCYALVDIAQTVIFIYFCQYERNSIVVFLCLLLYQLFCILLLYTDATKERDDSDETRETVSFRVRELIFLSYRYLSTTFLYNFIGFSFSLASFTDILWFQMLLTIYMWVVSNFQSARNLKKWKHQGYPVEIIQLLDFIYIQSFETIFFVLLIISYVNGSDSVFNKVIYTIFCVGSIGFFLGMNFRYFCILV